ncbi:hypothetical protein D8674_027168 [Pyrus ussuriensis x Pyrus communis]|uniref:Uncharacterized protein n=1 Tax=Pyrus ussuriensis x Pyrus communis TaxID=2448454 RepID=A0A5N5INV0_9ROSA|nr:hypothetical protein D8674_027168 [Pyrus ussuriensis x Pyrus communis]
MLRRGSVTISLLSNATVLVGWCQPRRRLRRRRGCTVWLGNKRRRFSPGSWPVLQLGDMAGSIWMFMKMVPNERWIDAYNWSLPILRPQMFPLC